MFFLPPFAIIVSFPIKCFRFPLSINRLNSRFLENLEGTVYFLVFGIHLVFQSQGKKVVLNKPHSSSYSTDTDYIRQNATVQYSTVEIQTI